MKKILPIILISLAVVVSGCASKRLIKRALKFESAGMYEMAADLFLQSLSANPKNVNAAVGLKKNGQRLLDEKTMLVHKAYFDGNDKSTVYSFLDAQAYFDKVKAAGITLNLSETAQSYYNEVKPNYLQKVYNEARMLLEEEKFKESEEKFAEIKRIDPGYQGVDEHMKVAMAEPAYRDGRTFLNNGFYRKAYYNFHGIITNHGTYKDAKDLRDEALSKALITISIGTIENQSRVAQADAMLEGAIVSALNNLSNPFIQVVDSKYSKELVSRQYRGVGSASEAKANQSFAPKSTLSGRILKMNIGTSKPNKIERKGYLKEMIEVKDSISGTKKEVPRYSKVTYMEVSMQNEVNISFQYQLISLETKALQASDMLNLTASDQTTYATFSGDDKKLIPGHWEFQTKSSPKDRIDDNTIAINKLQNLLKAPQNIKTTQQLQNELFSSVGEKVANKIDGYNPEN